METLSGVVPERIELEENGARFQVPLHTGQKTGWYYDHRGNRELMTRLVGSGRVLDVFGYLGAWAIQALKAGATQATCIESSTTSAAQIVANAKLNGCEDKLELLDGDAFDALRNLRAGQRQFDLVVVDRRLLSNGARTFATDRSPISALTNRRCNSFATAGSW